MPKIRPQSNQVETTTPRLKLKSRKFKGDLKIWVGMIAIPAILCGYFGMIQLHRLIRSSTSTNSNDRDLSSSQVSESSKSPTTIQAKKNPVTITKLSTNNSPELDRVVNRAIEYCKSKNLPTESLSISLLDPKSGKYSGYQNTISRYPASVVKIFWLFYAYDRQSDKIKDFEQSIYQMIDKSDNLGASQVLDAITNTKSTDRDLSPDNFQPEREKRQLINSFYQSKGYSSSINVSQKTFPIPQQNLMEPKGFDRQLRGEDPQKPLRNKITTDDATLLMSEIIQHPRTEMKQLLTRNISPSFWRKQPPNPIDFNPVESFFGERLENLEAENIISKAGWTSISRQEVAYIRSKDGKKEYILTVFGDSEGYAKDKKLFPDISKLVYREMQKLGQKNSQN
jgi:hypothetical protein